MLFHAQLMSPSHQCTAAAAALQVMVYLTSSCKGDAAPLAEGQEMHISYVANCTPLTAFLTFGFVPPELM